MHILIVLMDLLESVGDDVGSAVSGSSDII